VDLGGELLFSRCVKESVIAPRFRLDWPKRNMGIPQDIPLHLYIPHALRKLQAALMLGNSLLIFNHVSKT
jgi:hypothetical protein